MSTSPFYSRSSLAALLTGVCVLSGCGKAPIEAYRVPHETPKAANAPGGDMASQAVPAASGAPDVKWAIPDGWQSQPDQTGMRKGSFVVKDNDGHEATIAVTVFPGDVGGDLANINRWLGQIQQAPVGEADLSRMIKETPLAAGVFKRVDLIGGETPADPAHDHRARILGAWLKQETRTWFFKMTGDATLVGAQQASFDAFLASVRFVEPTASPSSTVDHAAAPALPAMVAPADTPAAPVASAGGLSWTAPASWRGKDLGAMRKASFTVGEGGDFSVISFPGDAGGDLANVNRWRGQIKLPPVNAEQFAAESESVKAGELVFTVVDYTGGDTRLLGAMLHYGGQTWFFKLMGPASVVGPAKPEFVAFLQSVTAR